MNILKINQTILLILLQACISIILFSSNAEALTFYKTFPEIKKFEQTRVVNIDPSDYSGEYQDAIEDDPYESINRAVFTFNGALDKFFFEPVARGYRYAVPEWSRDRVYDFFNNLKEITNFANGALQGDLEAVFTSFWRFTVNSTFGIAGFYDVAAGFGLHEKDKSFSQTLGLYGIGSGNYIVLPLLGPSTSRDFVGQVANRFTDPNTYITADVVPYAIGFVEIIETRENLLDLTEEIEFTSFDPYATYKSGYLQNKRKSFIETLE